jgi:predicted nuclease of predicted toxin-antitoxin system
VKLFFDQNLSFKLCAALRDLFPGSSQARLADLDTADDQTIWRYAAENDYVLVSQDADFAEMAALYGPPPKVIWLRGGNRATSAVETLIRHHAELARIFVDDPEAACLEIG